MQQKSFNPIDFGFAWTTDWYTFDSKAAHSAALKARNAFAKQMAAQGYTVRKWSLSNQWITRGGIGSSHPEITQIVTVYYVNWS